MQKASNVFVIEAPLYPHPPKVCIHRSAPQKVIDYLTEFKHEGRAVDEIGNSLEFLMPAGFQAQTLVQILVALGMTESKDPMTRFDLAIAL